MNGRIGTLAALAAAAWIMVAGNASAQVPDPRNTTLIVDFPDCCPRPAWWDEEEVTVRIGSMDEFLAVWQDKGLSDRRKAKALFQAVEDSRLSDDDITAAAVNYFYWVGRDYGHIRRLYEFGVGRYLDYDRPLERYSGKAGDMTAGMVNKLAKIYLREGEPERAVPWLQYILENREAEVNDHLLETASVHLGDALARLGRGPEAIEVLLAARSKYEGDWEKLLDKKLAEVRDQMGLAYYFHDQRLAKLALGAFGFGLLAVFVIRRRRPRRL
jgi:tetratricopeptide (TPR) repeat protein